MADAPLSDLALARLYGGRAADAASEADAALGAALRRLHDEGAQAFPGVRLDVEVFVGHLAAHAAAGLPPAGRGPDLYLACACATRVRGAVAALDRDQRRILRRHFADGITLDALAVELGVHRATVARHLAAARAALRGEVRRRLQVALGGADFDLGSLARTMRSRLDLSLPGLLRSTDGGAEPG